MMLDSILIAFIIKIRDENSNILCVLCIFRLFVLFVDDCSICRVGVSISAFSAFAVMFRGS